MKKRIAAFLLAISIVFTTAIMAGCSIGSTEDYYLSTSSNPLNVVVVALSPESGRHSYEIQVGVVCNSEESQTTAIECSETALKNILSRYKLHVSYLGTALPYKLSGFGNMDSMLQLLCFSVVSDGFVTEPIGLKSVSSDFGFFNIERKYEMVMPEWVGDIKDYFLSMSGFATKGYTIYDTSFAFCAGLSDSVKSNDAKRIYKSVYESMISCLCFKIGDVEDKYECYTSAMASGWYIIAIVAGIFAVAVIYLKANKKNGGNNVTVEDIANCDVECDCEQTLQFKHNGSEFYQHGEDETQQFELEQNQKTDD